MGQCWDPAGVEEQTRRASRGATREWMSARRLAAVWAERDAEVEARLKEVPEVAYKFTCKHCGSRFSLAQELEEHEVECGKAGSPEEPAPPEQARARACKYCGQVFQNFGEYGAHRWAEHREEVLTELAKKRQERKADEKKIDAGIAGKKTGEVPGTSPQRRRTSPPATQPNGATCPTCGGVIPARTAQLVKELTDLGIAESQAFEAARIARRVLAQGAAA